MGKLMIAGVLGMFLALAAAAPVGAQVGQLGDNVANFCLQHKERPSFTLSKEEVALYKQANFGGTASETFAKASFGFEGPQGRCTVTVTGFIGPPSVATMDVNLTGSTLEVSNVQVQDPL